MPRRTRDVRASLEQLCDALVGTELGSKIPLLQAQHGCPLVEDIEDNPDNKSVTFFYVDEGGECERASICSYSFFSPILNPDRIGIPLETETKSVVDEDEMPNFPMKKLDGTNIWFLSREVPAETLFSYRIETPASRVYDPLNPIIFGPSDDTAPSVSVLDLSQSYNQQQLDKGGRLIEQHQRTMADIKKQGHLKRYLISDSGVLTEVDLDYDPPADPQTENRVLTVHLPQDCDETKTYPMRLFLDGRWALNDLDVPAILDDGTINVMLEPKAIHGNATKDRVYDYAITPDAETIGPDPILRPDLNIDRFAEFLTGPFISCVQEELHVSSDASKCTICGSSLSGFAAMYIGLHHPEVFGNVLTQSAALWNFWPEGEQATLRREPLSQVEREKLLESLQRILREGDVDLEQLKTSCFYLEASKIEYSGNLSTNQTFAKLMAQQEIPHTTFVETCGEHGPAAWSQSLLGAAHSLREKRIELDATQETEKRRDETRGFDRRSLSVGEREETRDTADEAATDTPKLDGF
jgi:hypothetical protein